MFDTHCHLQFPNSSWTPLGVNNIIKRAKDAGVKYIMVPGTDLESSKKAVEIAAKFEGVYAAVGIHPHHIFKFQLPSTKFQTNPKSQITKELKEIEELLSHPKVVAVGEIGVDRHYYKRTKYSDYQITNEFIGLQKEILKKQIELALKYQKSLILHNREAIEDLLEVIKKLGVRRKELAGRAVFHCCEPENELLEFAKRHGFFIGVDGDVTYWKEKEEWVKKLPLEMMVLETDSPFLTPVYPPKFRLPDGQVERRREPINEPANLKIIAEYIAKLKGITVKYLTDITTANAKTLFGI